MNKYYCQYVYQVPQGYSSTISFIESIETKYFGRQLSDVIFLGLHGALVNKKPISPASKVAFDLGQSVYPLRFQKSEKGYKLTNFDEIKVRWEDYCETACREEKSDYIKEWIKRSAEVMKSKEMFLHAIMQGTFLQLMLFRDKQKELSVPNFPNPNTPLRWQLEKSLLEATPQVWYMKAQPLEEKSYFVGGYGTLEVTKSQWGNPKSIHMELRVEMSNEGYYHKMADINLIEE